MAAEDQACRKTGAVVYITAVILAGLGFLVGATLGDYGYLITVQRPTNLSGASDPRFSSWLAWHWNVQLTVAFLTAAVVFAGTFSLARISRFRLLGPLVLCVTLLGLLGFLITRLSAVIDDSSETRSTQDLKQAINFAV